MNEIKKIAGQTQEESLRSMLESIAEDLDLGSYYNGRMIVGRKASIHYGDGNVDWASLSGVSWDYFPCLYVAEEILENIIFAIFDGFYGTKGRKEIKAVVVDHKAEPVVMRHLEKYVDENDV